MEKFGNGVKGNKLIDGMEFILQISQRQGALVHFMEIPSL